MEECASVWRKFFLLTIGLFLGDCYAGKQRESYKRLPNKMLGDCYAGKQRKTYKL